MSRRFVDRSLRHWEAFASTGWQGVPRPALLVFLPEDGERRPSAVEIEGSRAELETRLEGMSDGELCDMVELASLIK